MALALGKMCQMLKFNCGEGLDEVSCYGLGLLLTADTSSFISAYSTVLHKAWYKMGLSQEW